jgi:hypothetical protein
MTDELQRRLDGAEPAIKQIIRKAESIYESEFDVSYTSSRHSIYAEKESRDMVVMQIAAMLQVSLYGDEVIDWHPVARGIK